MNNAAIAGETIRIATFNVAMGLEQDQLARRLQRRDDEALCKIAAIIQHIRPDILLINEFDDEGQIDRADLFNRHYLNQTQFGQKTINYPYHYSAPVNTGVASGVDLDGNGDANSPGDTHGFGRFPGQYSMLVLSRFPINREQARSWQRLRWRDFPGAALPRHADGRSWYSTEALNVLRLSSKSHWDVPIQIGDEILHFLTAHPTPPVFDGDEDRNGLRNRDEIALLAQLITPGAAQAYSDDNGVNGGLPEEAYFVIAGDMNADPLNGDSAPGAMQQLLDHPLINNHFTPTSQGARLAATSQGGNNLHHQGDPATATADFNDDPGPGNLRIDYVLPRQGLKVINSGVFWPTENLTEANWIDASDHRMVWIDIQWPPKSN